MLKINVKVEVWRIRKLVQQQMVGVNIMVNNYPSYFMCLIQITQFVMWKVTYMSHFKKLRVHSTIIGNYLFFSCHSIFGHLMVYRLIDGYRKWKREGYLLLFCLITHVAITELFLVCHHTVFASIILSVM